MASNGMALLTVNGLQCGVTYTIIAGGTLNGDLVGPRSSHGNITTNPCPIASKLHLLSCMYGSYVAIKHVKKLEYLTLYK